MSNGWHRDRPELHNIAKTVAHGYERIYLQRPRLSHAEIVRAFLAERTAIIARSSPDKATSLSDSTSSLLRVGNVNLSDVALHILIAELQQDYADFAPCDLQDIRALLAEGIQEGLGYVPDDTLVSIEKRRERDRFLASEDGYRAYLKSTFGAIPPQVPPTARWENAVLRTQSEWESALQQVYQLGLPAHFQSPKNWDGLAAIDCVLRTTRPDARILDAGAELYSVFLPSLSLYGYMNLLGINLVFEDEIKLGPIRYQHGNLTSTEFPANTFDVVACLSVIEHGVDLDKYFAEMFRILRKGGLLITSTDYFETPIDVKGAVDFGTPVHIFDRDELSEALVHARGRGFELTSPLSLACMDKPVRWEEFDLDYTFLIFTLRKMGG